MASPTASGIDLFCGAGGMSLGARLAGVRTLAAVERDPWAAETYRRNHPFTRLFEEDVRKIGPSQLPTRMATVPLILFGGPPCQGFSTSNQRTRSSENPENWLFHEFLRLTEALEPDWIVFENVKGIVETERGKFLQAVLCRFRSLGYSVAHGLLNAADFGVPQNRWRLFVVGSRHHISPSLPSPSGDAAPSVLDAISDLPELENGASIDTLEYPFECYSRYAKGLRRKRKRCNGHLVTRNAQYVVERYAHVPPGGNWEDIPRQLMRNYSFRSEYHTGVYHRLRPDVPSIVIGNFRKNMLIHPFADRGLSIREAARLQSFPDAYTFFGSIGFQQQQVGNAVPPKLAEAVFREVLAQ